MRKIIVSIGLLTLMGVMSQSSAQQFDREMFRLIQPVMRVLGDNPATLTLNPQVQQELKLDEDQVKAVREKVTAPGLGGFGLGGGGFGKGKLDEAAREKLREQATKMQERIATLRDVPEDELDAKIRETFKEEIEGSMKAVEEVLNSEQMGRLKQISRQQGGLNAYLKPENVKDLGLSDDQKTKLKEISDELQKDVGELRRGAAGAGGAKGGFGRVSPEVQEKIDALTKEAREKADGVLTDEQKSKWKELTGEPFTVRGGGFGIGGGGGFRPKQKE
jgi:hypothetical protein